MKYSFRNLFRRKARTCFTVLGLGLALASVSFMLAFSRSLAAAVRHTGDPDNIIIISKKAQNHILSSIPAKDSDQIRNKLSDYAATGTIGNREKPLISREVYMGINIEPPGGASAVQPGKKLRAVIHGVDPVVAMKVNHVFKLVEGTLPGRDKHELLCGVNAGARIGMPDEELQVGRHLHLLGRDWRICGRFEAPGNLMECEIWTHVDDLRIALTRRDYSLLRCKLKNPGAMDALIKQISTDEQFQVKAFPETAFFADYAAGFDYFRQFAVLLTILITAGGIITGMNTMYTAVMGRVREIGTLQIIGFSRISVLAGLVAESTIISLAGGALGSALGMLANGISMKIPMAAFKVQVDSMVVLWTFIAAAGIGVFGALIPAFRALKLRIVDAVRYE
jgi:hypothetical protein